MAATIGRLRLELHDPRNAITKFEQALEGQLEDPYSVHEGLGRCYERQGDYKSAIDHYRMAIEDGEITARNFHIDQAITCCEKAIEKK